MTREKNIIIENGQLRFRNFSGKEGKYNPEGHRNFCVLLDDDVAEKLEQDGWNVRYLTPIDPSENPQGYIQVKVRFDNWPPKIVVVTSNGKTILNEETVGMLDWAEFETVDLEISPYHWTMASGNSGITAYLKTMYAKIYEDPFEEKYMDAPDSAESSIGGCGCCEECDGSCKHDC